jgi:hypothetical protein
VWTGSYVLAVRLRLEDTPWGAGNGTYDSGSGRATLRFTKNADETSPTKVELLSYETHERFVVDSHVLFVHAKVKTESTTRATPDARGVVATGTMSNRQAIWSTPARGYRTDGTLHCEGSGCGSSGVPPSGTSELHIGPNDVMLAPFRFESDALDTFHMAYTKVARTEMPKQTAFASVAARLKSRDCVEK